MLKEKFEKHLTSKVRSVKPAVYKRTFVNKGIWRSQTDRVSSHNYLAIQDETINSVKTYKMDDKEKGQFELAKRALRNSSFYKTESFDDLEISNLEEFIQGDRNYVGFDSFGMNLLHVLIRNPVTNIGFLTYIQDGVKELVENTDFNKQLNKIFTGYKNLFRSSEEIFYDDNAFYAVKNFNPYINCLNNINNLFQNANSQILRDISTSLARVLSQEDIFLAKKISSSKEHIFRLTEFGDRKDGNENRNLILEYVYNGRTIPIKSRGVWRELNNGSVTRYALMGDVKTAMHNILEKDGFAAIDNTRLTGAFLGYLNGLSNLVNKYEENNIEWCFPRFTTKNVMKFFKSSHPLLIGNVDEVTTNDIYLSNNPRMLVLSGANEGGKTTFGRQTGVLTVMSQLGAPIPAKFGLLKPVKNIYTHFEKTESTNEARSKFTSQLCRMRGILHNITKDDLAILDEPTAGTSDEDGLQVSLDIIRGLNTIKAKTVYTTHLHKVQQTIAENPKDYRGIQNMRVVVKGSQESPEFTYQMKQGVAGKSWGIERANDFLSVDKILLTRGYKMK